jgi:hypothetical protein
MLKTAYLAPGAKACFHLLFYLPLPFAALNSEQNKGGNQRPVIAAIDKEIGGN